MWFANFVKFQSFLLCLLIGQIAAEEKIVGGYPTTIVQVPYLMQLFYDGLFTCGGTLVHGNLVVTAGHCVDSRVAAKFTVKGGATHLTDTGVQRGVDLIIKAKNFDIVTLNMDVAVLRLSSKMIGQNIKLINLCSNFVEAGKTVTVSGWGSLSEDGGVSNQVQQVKVVTVAKSTCNQDYDGDLTETMMCAASDGKDACFGDSGGPLTFGNELCGIVSWANGCAEPGFPGVYTNVYTIGPFIRKAINMYGS